MMTMMNNIEDYQNLVEVLKAALNFYSKASVEEMGIDSGFQARFALSKIEEVELQYKKMENEYNDSLIIDDDNAMLNKLEIELKNLKIKYGNNQI